MNRPFAKLALTAWVFGSAWMTGSTNAAEPKVQAVSARENGFFAVLFVKPSNSATAKLSLEEQFGSVLGGMGTGATTKYAAIAHSYITQCFDMNADSWVLLSPRDIDPQVRMAISSIHIEETQWGQCLKITMKEKIEALDKLAVHRGFNSELPDTEKLLAFVPEHLRDAVRRMLEEVSVPQSLHQAQL